MVDQPNPKTKINQVWKILIIDDDEDDFFLTRTMLKEARGQTFDVHWAQTYAAGQAELRSDAYHAVLVDYDLGAHSGIELIREASLRRYAAPLILFTGRGNYEVDVEAMEAGATLYLAKGEATPLLLERVIRYAIELKQKEQALKKAELKFNQAFHSSPAALAMTRASDGCYIEINESFCQVTGYSRDELLGHTAQELQIYAIPGQRAELLRLLREQGLVRNYEIMVRTKPGALRTILGAFDIVDLDSETCFLATLVDITERARAEDELRQSEVILRDSEQRYAALFNARTNGVAHCRVITNAQGQPVDYVILQINDAYEQITGIKRADIEGRLATQVFPGIEHFDFDYIGNYGRVALQGGELNFETFFEATQQWLSIYIYSPKPGEFTAIFTDISQRKQAEMALSASEAALRARENQQRSLAEVVEVERAKLAATIDHLPIGVSIGDIQGNVLYLNSAGLKLHGFASEAEMFPRVENYLQAFELRYPDGTPIPVAKWPSSRALRGDFVHDFELIMRRLDTGAERIVAYSAVPVKNSAGETILIAYTLQDLTERKATEAALKRSIEQERARAAEMRILMDTVPAMIWIARDRFCREMIGNRYGYEFLKMWQGANISKSAPEDSLKQQAYRNFKNGREIPTEELPMQQAAANGSTATNYDFDLVFDDGEVRSVLGNVNPLFDPQGQPSGAVGVFMDITERRKVEEQVQHYARELERSNQALQDFAAIASHDLQEPVRKIIMFGSSLRKQLTDAADLSVDASADASTALDYLNRMQSAAERMQVMIRGLLELSRVNTQAEDFAPVDLNRIVAEVIGDLEARLDNEGGQVIVEPLPTLEADALQMHQLFQNLIGNAIKFHRPQVPPVVRVTGALLPGPKSATVEIQVADNGIGFDPQQAERIFQPFQRLHSRAEFEGTGLGLAICQKIVERHQGDIQVQSTPGEGSRFIIHLPAKPTLP